MAKTGNSASKARRRQLKKGIVVNRKKKLGVKARRQLRKKLANRK